MSEIELLDKPDLENIPASDQVTLEEPEVDARHGWMKAAYEEVLAIRANDLNAKDSNFVFSDVSIHDKMQQKLLIDAGYKPDFENPGNSEKDGIMFYKKSREDHELPYKAEVKARNLNERKMLKHQGSKGGVQADPKIGQETFDEARSRMADNDIEFHAEENAMVKMFNELDTSA